MESYPYFVIFLDIWHILVLILLRMAVLLASQDAALIADVQIQDCLIVGASQGAVTLATQPGQSFDMP